MKVIIASISSNRNRLMSLARRNGFDPVFVSALKAVKLDISSKLSEYYKYAPYSWAAFFSVTSVSLFFSYDVHELITGARIAAVGSGTADFLKRKGVKVDFIPSQYTTERLAEELPAQPGSRVLILRSRDGSSAAEEILKRRGIKPFRLDLYETSFVSGPINQDKIRGARVIVFGSSREVAGFEKRLEASGISEFKKNVAAACIGPLTMDAAAKMGYKTLELPKVYTYRSLFKLLSELRNEGRI